MTITTSRLHVVKTKEQKTIVSPVHKTFNRLIKKVKNLQDKQEFFTQELDASLQFYFAHILPEKDVIKSVYIERVKTTYDIYTISKSFSKKERNTLKEMIIEDIDTVGSMGEGLDVPCELKAIFAELNGVDYDEVISEEFSQGRDQMQEQFKQCGIDIDLSDIDMTMSSDEVMQKIFRTLENSGIDLKTLTDKKQKKQKKQTNNHREKELKKQVFEEMLQKDLNTIYRKLAKLLHPDLEQDPEQKRWKEELIKKLTTAYANSDLYALLTLEMEWVNRTSGQLQSQSDKQFEIYNMILKDQAKALQSSIDGSLFHPKYRPLQMIYNGYFDGVSRIKKYYGTLKEDIQDLQALVTALKTPQAINILKEAIKSRSKKISDADLFSEIFSE